MNETWKILRALQVEPVLGPARTKGVQKHQLRVPALLTQYMRRDAVDIVRVMFGHQELGSIWYRIYCIVVTGVRFIRVYVAHGILWMVCASQNNSCG